MNRNDWNNASAGVRLALLLAVFLLGFSGYFTASGSSETPRLQALMLALAVYGLGLAAAVWLPWINGNPRRQGNVLTGLMVLVVATAAVLTDVAYMAALLWLPALHGVLRLGQRAAALTVGCCGLLWLVLNSYPNPGDYLSWLKELMLLLPAALVLWVVRGLTGEVSNTRNRITALSYRDELTGLLNMRAFTRMLQGEHRKAAAGSGQYALLMIVIDHLQVFNDRYGHEQGNRVIVAVADAIKRSTRSDALIARYGGDEFVVFLPGAGDDAAEIVTNRIAQNVYNITLSFDRSMQRVTVNTGRAVYPDSGSSIQDMMSFADRAMHRNKNFSRNVQQRKADISQLKAQAGVEDWG